MNNQIKGINALIKQQLECAEKDMSFVLSMLDKGISDDRILKQLQLVKDHIHTIEAEIEYKQERNAIVFPEHLK